MHSNFKYRKVLIAVCALFFAHTLHAQIDRNFKHIDLSEVVNQGFVDEQAGDGKGGWADFGYNACFREMNPGIQVFKDGIVPFQVIDPGENEGLAALVLSGPKREKVFPKTSPRIKVGQKLEALFFLHTTLYADREKDELVTYRIHYKDKSEEIFTCINKENIHDWWIPPKRMPGAVRCYEESNKWLITAPWKNPNPGTTIEWVQMESTGNAIPVLVAITGSINIDPYDEIQAHIEKQYEQYALADLKIATLQIRSQSDTEWNLRKGEEFCRKAREMGADIALFPEMYNLGYNGINFHKPGAIEEWKGMAIGQDSEYITHFRKLAKELEMAIVITYLEDIGNNRLPSNSATLIDRHGDIVFTYSKVHTCEFANMENATTPGEGFFVEELDTKAGPVKIGMMICYDREAPESARILMLNGAEIILTPNACNLEDLRLGQFRSRAFENAIAAVMTNYGTADANDRFNGHSCIYGADGSEVLMAGSQEGVYIGSINIHDLRSYRKETIWGNAFRRPHKYNEMVSPKVDTVFKRTDSFGDEFERLKR